MTEPVATFGAGSSGPTVAPVGARAVPLGRATVLGLALTLFVVISGLRLASEDPTAQIATFLLLPIALLGMEFGLRGGLLSALAAMVVVFAWLFARDVDLGVVGVLERCVPFALLGAFFGVLGTRLSQAVTDRALIADQIVYMEGLTGHGLIRLDSVGSITAWNVEAAGLLGFSAADAESHSLAMIFGGETGAESALAAMLRGAIDHGHHSEERWLSRKDGARRLTAISVTPLGARGAAGFAVVLRDLTASKAVLHGSSRMWEVSLEMLATASFDGYIQHANPRWTEILDWTVEELQAIPLIDLVHVEDRERYTAETAKLGHGAQEAVSFEARFRARDGSYRWMLWNSMAGVDDDLIYAAARDVTDRKRQDAALAAIDAELRVLSAELEVRVEQRTGELAAANKELEAFSYSVSHDLRAPLRAIDGYSLAILEDYASDLPDPVQADLTRVRAASQRMSLMIDEMLALSRVTRQELLDEPVDLTAMADEVAGELRAHEAERDVEVEIEAGMNVTGDPVLLRLVIHNLLENAYKFTARTEAAHVDVARIGSEAGRSTFAVRDNGAGFDMRYADKLFRPFERLHRQDEFRGTGVGLTTVSRILNRHGGRIWADGTPGEGASFYFELPTEAVSHA